VQLVDNFSECVPVRRVDASANARSGSGEDDAGFFALEFGGGGELAAEEFDEAAGAGAAVGAQQAHAIEKDEELEDLGVLRVAEGALRRRLFGFGEEGGEGIVEAALYGRNRRLFVDNAGGERLVGFGEGMHRSENIGISCGGFTGADFRDGEGDSRKKLGVEADEVRSKADIEQWSVRGNGSRVLLFVAVSGEQIAAVGWAVERDFALGTATDGADFFGFGGAKAFRLAFLADWTGHEVP